jgi:hypothetical protein
LKSTREQALKLAHIIILLGLALLCGGRAVLAVEGTTAAGPIGGTDIRSAQLPPPGLYGGVIGLISPVKEIHDGGGQPVPGLNAVDLIAKMVGPFFVYVPDLKLWDGSIGLIGVFPVGQLCGQVISAVPRRCVSGFGDPYFELSWSRSFGQLRRSRDPTALPILEGLTVSVGLGVVVPIGHYNAQTQAANGVTIGNNTWDVAPSIAVTYTTAPLLAEGTEFSAKLYWNNYWTNPQTHYQAGSLLDVDFAVTERIGRFQLGLTGFYAFQIADDRQFGVIVGPDGRRIKYLNLGGVLNYDIPEWGAVFRIKALSTIVSQNAVVSKALVIGLAKKLY